MNFAKFLKATFLQNTSRQLLLTLLRLIRVQYETIHCCVIFRYEILKSLLPTRNHTNIIKSDSVFSDSIISCLDYVFSKSGQIHNIANLFAFVKVICIGIFFGMVTKFFVYFNLLKSDTVREKSELNHNCFVKNLVKHVKCSAFNGF